MTINFSHAQKVSLVEAKPYLTAFQKQIEIPAVYKFVSVNKVKIDTVSAYLFRYEKEENKGLEGEHFSFLVGERDQKILGFINMDKKYANAKLLPDEEAEKIALGFLNRIDAGLAAELKKQWHARHDDSININGEKTTLAVSKFKYYRSSLNDYVWVYVGFDGAVQSFERDTKWDMTKRQRFAEQWIHDAWRVKNKK